MILGLERSHESFGVNNFIKNGEREDKEESFYGIVNFNVEVNSKKHTKTIVDKIKGESVFWL